MEKKDVNELYNGVYRVYWKESRGGGYSLASIGRLRDGTVSMICSNWGTDENGAVQSADFKNVKRVVIIEKRY